MEAAPRFGAFNHAKGLVKTPQSLLRVLDDVVDRVSYNENYLERIFTLPAKAVKKP